jgi:hypothetical protein
VGDPPISLKSLTEMVTAVNDNSIIIQEYVQARVSDFLENYAKEVFGIHHYNARFGDISMSIFWSCWERSLVLLN